MIERLFYRFLAWLSNALMSVGYALVVAGTMLSGYGGSERE